jgi:large subunit ribosomal protein L21
VTVGTPTVDGATVSGTVLGEALGPKLIVFKFKQKATYRRKNGHRQHLTRVRIDEINTGGKRGKAAATKADDGDATAAAATTETETKPARKPAARKPAATKASAASDSGDEAKPKRTRKPAAKKAEAEE